MISALPTIHPNAPWRDEVYRHPLVRGVRLNTVMPHTGGLDDHVARLADEAREYGTPLWIDLKGRQLRVATYGTPPFTEIELTHEIEVKTPTTAYFSDGNEEATLLAVEGKRLIFQDSPRRVVGPGESVNIPDPSLKIKGSLTDTDKRYIEASQRADLHTYMLSFVERESDLVELRTLDPQADIVAKIESRRGVAAVESMVRRGKQSACRLFAARGDLYVEMRKPHDVLGACETILTADPHAIVGSRILTSLSTTPTPSCADINDVDNLLRMGYRTLMLGDDVCLRRESVLSALNAIEAIAERYNR